MNSNPLPLFAALVSVVLWAAAFVGIRAAGRSFSPGPLALGRLAIGSVLLGAVVRSRPTVRPTRRELVLLVLAGLLWFGVYQVVLNEAEQRVDAGTASMLVLIAPIFIVALAAVFLKERTTPNLLLGGALAFATWAYALARGSAGRLAATAYLVPPITIALSWLILGEAPSGIAGLGGALCLLGVAIARKAPTVRASEPAPAPRVPPAHRR